ncbi:hypothetical protein ACFQU7_08320 [Pseudoroseomonas wenyumeiae]
MAAVHGGGADLDRWLVPLLEDWCPPLSGYHLFYPSCWLTKSIIRIAWPRFEERTRNSIA